MVFPYALNDFTYCTFYACYEDYIEAYTKLGMILYT